MKWGLRTVWLGLAGAAVLAAGCGDESDDGSESGSSAASYSVPTEELDRALDCKGGTDGLDGDGESEPVLLVPGTTVTREQDWGANYWAALPDRGYEVCWVQLPDLSFGDIQISAEYIARAVERMHEASGEEIDVIGHSQGGVSPRWAIKWFPSGAFVDDQIALAAPNHGAVTADRDTSRGQAPEAIWQLDTDSNFIAALNGGDESPGSTDYTSIYSKTDELLRSVETPRIDGATNVLLQELCPGRQVSHVEIVSDDVTYTLVIDALSHPGAADSGRAGVECARGSFPGAGDFPPGGPRKGIDIHVADEEPPLMPYAQAG